MQPKTRFAMDGTRPLPAPTSGGPFTDTFLAGRGEIAVPRRYIKQNETAEDLEAIAVARTDDDLIAAAHQLYGSNAPTALAYCGLDAWFDGEDEEFKRVARLFNRLRN